MVELIKEARKKSEDPVQESLRQHKDTWNHEASLLIAQLIAFKKGLNGRGDPRVGIPPGSIKDPMPHEVGSYLDQLAERYNKLISDAHSIIDEQNIYSETRKKSVKEQTASNDYDELVKLASWWGSRALTYTKNQYLNPKYWFSSDEAIKARMTMLKVSVDLVKQAKVIDNYIVSKNINAIPNAVYDFDKFVSSYYKLLLSNVKKLSSLEKDNEKIEKISPENKQIQIDRPELESPNVSSTDRDTTEELHTIPLELSGEKPPQGNGRTAKQILTDIVVAGRIVQVMKLMGVTNSDMKLFQSGVNNLRKLLDNIIINNSGSLEKANNDYNDLLKFSGIKLGQDYSDSLSSQLEKSEKLLISKAGLVSADLEKLAKNYLSRWLKRQKLKILPDSDDRIRLEASKKVSTLLDLLNKFQNILEKNEPNLDVIKDSFLAIGNQLGELSDDLYYLGKTHNDEYEQNRLNGKPHTHMIKLQTLSRLHHMKDEIAKLSADLA